MNTTRQSLLFTTTLAFILSTSLVSGPALSFTPTSAPSETQSAPGNMLLALSVEFPTGLQISYTSANYTSATVYEGYFDNRKCYSYSTTNEVFTPQSGKKIDDSCPDSSHWSGNILNWLTMTNLDQFRSVMTGGTRDNFSSKNSDYPGDTVARTVLIRSLSDRNSYNPLKNLNSTWPGLPSGYGSGTKIKVRSGGYGSKFFVSGGSFTNLPDIAAMKETCAATVARGLANMTECFNIRVEVCKEVPAVTTVSPNVAAVGRENNCVGPYGTEPNTYYKPQGLIQEYSNSIRFGAMGYLNESGQSRNGGVLRAAMKSVGAVNIGEGGTSNTHNEWGADGLLVVNPNPSDATASSVAQSGVINYLNKFGYEAGYKGNDPVGELYYASQLYLRNQSFPTNYTDSLNAAKKDGFPVITSFSNPIIKSCQKNFILGIGDIYTHCDGNLPGSPSTGGETCPGGTPTDPNGLNVGSLWDSVTTMEGSTTWVGGATQGKPYMAGLAWWANVNDIQPDMAGKQTISTYWVDVLENNNGGAGIGAKSQFWLAAKYGGFRQDLVSANGTNPNTTTLSWDKNGDGRPDTLFAGNSPTVLKTSLRAAFEDIAARADESSASSAAVTSNRQTSNSQIIYAGYNPKDWTGGVRSCTVDQTATQCEASPVWEVSRWFDATYTSGATPKLTSATRNIFTSIYSGGTFSDMPFLWASLNTTQQGFLNSSDSLGSQRVSYLRGSRADEGTTFRVRGPSLMGDVVNSNVTYLAGSGPSYRGANFPGHSTFRAANASRPAVVYVGANDGMLHAFNASNGKELWGYIPGSVYANLPSLTNTSFVHKYFVDASAMVSDTQTSDPQTPWRTMLVGGLGGGGKGYYALDISRQTPDSVSLKSFSNMTEAELSAIPMWEFTSAQDSDLGYTYYEPALDPVNGSFNQIAKVADATTASGVWRVILNNGPGSSSNSAVLFMLNAETGAVVTKIVATSSGSGDNGLSSPYPVDTDKDGLIDTVYAGDLRGRMHKFQFSKLAENNTDYKLAKSGDTDGVWRHLGAIYESGVPITAAPIVTTACKGTGLQVLFGTGKLNESADFTDTTTTQSFFSVLDNEPSSTLTIASTSLATITATTSTVTEGTVRNWTAPSLINKKGWKINFTGGERILSNPSLPPDTGAVLFGTSKPSGDICEPGSSGFIMSVNICNAGIGELTLSDGTAVGGLGSNASGVLKVSPSYLNFNNKYQALTNQKECQGKSCTQSKKTAPAGRYSWREVLTR